MDPPRTWRRDAIVSKLLSWFAENARDLPWRRTRDPYAIWLSEVMLQQTRVETVIPYYERFLKRFPDVRALAAADVEDVLGLWSGLGYYRRARGLHTAALEVCERHGGELPAAAAELRKLRGVGPYTAGAIASIAFGEREPLVDGNVARVFARVFAIDEPIDANETRKRLWAIAAELVPSHAPGPFNEALMELGATVCTPDHPSCGSCPLEGSCAARSSGREQELPRVRAKKPVPRVKLIALVVHRGGAVLVGRREPDGLFGGLWEPPMGDGSSAGAAADLARSLSLRARDLRLAGRVEHVLTHRRLEVLVFAGGAGARTKPVAAPPYARFSWLDPATPELAMSTLARKVLALGNPGS